MFEQATLTDGPAGKRALATFIGFTSQAVLLTFAIMAPMLWPQILPVTHVWETLAPPGPPPAPPPLVRSTSVKPTRLGRVSLTRYQPTTIPGTIPLIVEEPAGTSTDSTALAVPGGTGVGTPNNFIGDLVRSIAPVAPPRPVEAPPKPPEAPPATQRFTVGGNVRLGAVLHKAEPAYPAIAKAARVSGDVELQCVVGVDGYISEVKVRSGNGLLVRAAVDAAWQWIYTPSKLNGVPIEIVTILKFSFKLN